MNFATIILEFIGWLRIVIGVTLFAVIIAYLTYFKWNNETGKTVAIIIVSIGFILGAIWATQIWKKHGTRAWLSRIRRPS